MVMLVSEIDYETQLDSKEWVAELKRDGNRLQLHYNRAENSIKFLNRKGDEYTKGIPTEILTELTEAFEKDNYVEDCIIDGELTFTDIKGVDHRTQAQCPDADPVFWVWDILELNGEDLREQKWLIRKKELKTICEIYDFFYRSLSSIRYLPHYIDKRGALKVAKDSNQEGIILKHINGLYEEGKTKNQIKVKFDQTDDYIVVGYTLASEFSTNTKGEQINNKRFNYFKALVLAQYDKNGILVSKGMLGGGFKDEDLLQVCRHIDRDINDDNTRTFVCENSSSKKEYPIFTDKDYSVPKNTIRWLDNSDWFVVEVKMQNLTEYGNPFQPRFIALRPDKKLEECIIK